MQRHHSAIRAHLVPLRKRRHHLLGPAVEAQQHAPRSKTAPSPTPGRPPSPGPLSWGRTSAPTQAHPDAPAPRLPSQPSQPASSAAASLRTRITLPPRTPSFQAAAAQAPAARPADKPTSSRSAPPYSQAHQHSPPRRQRLAYPQAHGPQVSLRRYTHRHIDQKLRQQHRPQMRQHMRPPQPPPAQPAGTRVSASTPTAGSPRCARSSPAHNTGQPSAPSTANVITASAPGPRFSGSPALTIISRNSQGSVSSRSLPYIIDAPSQPGTNAAPAPHRRAQRRRQQRRTHSPGKRDQHSPRNPHQPVASQVVRPHRMPGHSGRIHLLAVLHRVPPAARAQHQHRSHRKRRKHHPRAPPTASSLLRRNAPSRALTPKPRPVAPASVVRPATAAAPPTHAATSRRHRKQHRQIAIQRRRPRQLAQPRHIENHLPPAPPG